MPKARPLVPVSQVVNTKEKFLKFTKVYYSSEQTKEQNSETA